MMDLLFAPIDPEGDLALALIFVFISCIVVLIYQRKTKKTANALKILSVLSNLSFIANGDIFSFRFSFIPFFAYFTYYIWPVLNVALFVKQKILAIFLVSSAMNIFFAGYFLFFFPHHLGLFSGTIWPLFNVALLGYLLYWRYGRKKAVTVK